MGGNSSAVRSGAAWQRVLTIAVLLVAAWLLWSGLFKPLLLGLGVLSCGLTLLLLQRMGYFSDENYGFDYGLSLLGFWSWLGKEIIKSSLDVTCIVLARKIELQPTIVKLKIDELAPGDQALLGNSITLTPGTLALDVYQDRILVHALTPAGAAELNDGEMQRRVAALRKR